MTLTANMMRLAKCASVLSIFLASQSASAWTTNAEYMQKSPEAVLEAKKPIWVVEKCLVMAGLPTIPYRAPENPNEALLVWKNPIASGRIVARLVYEKERTKLIIFEGKDYLTGKEHKVCFM